MHQNSKFIMSKSSAWPTPLSWILMRSPLSSPSCKPNASTTNLSKEVTESKVTVAAKVAKNSSSLVIGDESSWGSIGGVEWWWWWTAEGGLRKKSDRSAVGNRNGEVVAVAR